MLPLHGTLYPGFPTPGGINSEEGLWGSWVRCLVLVWAQDAARCWQGEQGCWLTRVRAVRAPFPWVAPEGPDRDARAF